MTATDSPFDDATAATARGALITVTFNSAATLEHFWAAWQPSQDWEWIVVDNASTDTTVETARRLGARVIELPTNRGFSFANNVGYASTTADFIGFVNPDVAVTPESLGTLGETASLLGAIVGPQLLNGDGSRQPNGRGLPTLAAKIRNRIAAPDDRYLLFSPDGSPRPVYWLMGAAVSAIEPNSMQSARGTHTSSSTTRTLIWVFAAGRRGSPCCWFPKPLRCTDGPVRPRADSG